MTGPHADHARRLSFRDPDGSVFLVDGRIIRLIGDHAAAGTAAFLASTVAKAAMARGPLVPSRILPREEAARLTCDISGAGLVVEHERVPFVSYPHEWPAEMLYDAARLTLDLAREVLPDGFGLKDATPYNVTFRRGRPVFIDLLSFERRDPFDATWLPYAQFVRSFLLPLLAWRHFGISLAQSFGVHRDGPEPAEMYRLMPWLRRLLPPALELVSMPVWLGVGAGGARGSLYGHRRRSDAAEASFILHGVLRRLERHLERVRPAGRDTSSWSNYVATRRYSDDQVAAKRTFVQSALADIRPVHVLDIGCNTGEFTLLSAQAGASVVAIDADPVVVGELARTVRTEGLNVLPLTGDLASPAPAIGWRNHEYPAFLDRAKNQFDLVLMLAVLHHLLVNARAPLDAVVDLLADLSRKAVVIEFVAPDDELFIDIARGRDTLFAGITTAAFEEAVRQRFDIVRSQQLPSARRWLYLLRRR